MESLAKRRARIAPVKICSADPWAWGFMAVVGAVGTTCMGPSWSTIREGPSYVLFYGLLLALITLVLPAGLAVVSWRAPELAARRVAPMMAPFGLLWLSVLAFPLWAVFLWPFSFLVIGAVLLVAVAMGAFFADTGVRFVAASPRTLLDWFGGVALLLPFIGVAAAIVIFGWIAFASGV